MTKHKQGVILYYVGIAVSVIAPLITAMTQFPVWTEKVPKTQLGGMFVFTAILSCIPLLKHIRMQLKAPSAVTVWVAVFLICWAMDKLIDQLYVISIVGLVSNVIGAILCAVGNRLRRPPINSIQDNKENENNAET